MKRRALGLIARRSEGILFACTILLIALPFPTIGYGAADAWYALRGEVVVGTVLSTRSVREINYTMETATTRYVADVELVETGERIELRGIDLYEGIVRRGDTISIEAAPGGHYRPQLADGGQYGVWKLTGSVWLAALVVAWPVWRVRRARADHGELESTR